MQQFFLGKDGTYGKGEVLDSQEILQLKTIEGIEIMLWEVFEVERPLEEELSPKSPQTIIPAKAGIQKQKPDR